MAVHTDSPNILAPPPLIYVAGLALGVLAGRELGLPGFGIGAGARTTIGAILSLIGILVNFAGAGLFHRLRTAIIPFKPATRLVTSGIYRWTRNPMYLGMAIAYAGIAALFDSLLAVGLLPVVLAIVQTQVIAREEAYLERTFGESYRNYKEQVRRWI